MWPWGTSALNLYNNTKLILNFLLVLEKAFSLLFVCATRCVCMFICVHMHVNARGYVRCQSYSTLIFETQSLAEPGAPWSG